MSTGDLTVSAIVCAYSDKRRQQLTAALDSLRRQDTRPLEIIAVIDHNRALQEQISAEHSDVKTISNLGPKGPSASRNTGIQYASGDIVAFLDDDAVANAGWLTRMLVHYADPNVIGVGGAAIPQWPQRRPRWFPDEFDWVIGCSYRGQPKRAAPVRNVWGCNMSLRRNLFKRIDGFREAIGEGNGGKGCEETELCIRATQAFPQSTIVYDPELTVRHHVAPDRTHWRYFHSRCIAEGRSKAQVVDEVGAHNGLSSERSYVIRVLPAGILRGVSDAFLRFDPWGLARAGSIVAGLSYTTWGYLCTRWSNRRV
jgi:GT2 family glycosyltransferase